VADITLGFVYFRTTSLAHLDAAWFTVSRLAGLDAVAGAYILDNNTDDAPAEIQQVIDRYPVPFPVTVDYAKHGVSRRTHSWSVNRVLSEVTTPWVFFTRSDFLLDPTCLHTFRQTRDSRLERNPQWRGLVTSYCHQMGYDAALSNTDALAPHSLPDAPWRLQPDGLRGLVGSVPACRFHDADKDAGVWLTSTEVWRTSGGLNEKLVSWGYQQSLWQDALKRHGVEMVQIPDYLFHHQHHAAPRDPRQAALEVQRWAR